MTRQRLLPDADLRRLTERIVEMQGRIDTLERAARTTQLSNSSIEGGSLTIRDSSGIARGYVGMQSDGTSGVQVVNNPPPARPNTPDLEPILGGVAVSFNGELTDGPVRAGAFSHVAVYLSGAGPDFIHGPSNLVGTMSRAGRLIVAPLAPGSYWARFVAYNADTPQEASEPSFTGGPAQPLAVVADDVLDGIITETKLAAGAVSEAKIAAGAVTETKVADDAISTPKLVAGAVQTEKIAAGAVQAGNIAAESITGEKIAALSITGDKIAANQIAATHIQAGSVDAEKLAATLVVAGTPGGNRVQIDEVNGIEQWLGGSRTLWIPPSGLSEFVGGILTGTNTQFIRLEPDLTGFGAPQLVLRDDSSTRQISWFYQGDTMWLTRQVAGAAPSNIRGGQLYFAQEAVSLAHHSNSNGVVRSGIYLSETTASIESRSSTGVLRAYLGGNSSGQVNVESRNSSGAVQASIMLEASGNVWIDAPGNLNINGPAGTELILASGGTLLAHPDGQPKAFVIDHPQDPENRWLIHGCTESPDAGVEYWGVAEVQNHVAVVELPPYFEALTREDGRQAQVTVVCDPPADPVPDELSMNGSRRLTTRRHREEVGLPRATASIPADGRFHIACDGADGTRVAWLVKARRADVEQFDTEPLKSEVVASGFGPYRFFKRVEQNGE